MPWNDSQGEVPRVLDQMDLVLFQEKAELLDLGFQEASSLQEDSPRPEDAMLWP